MVFACCEWDLAALAFLDMPLFLISYFDPDWQVAQWFHSHTDNLCCTRQSYWSKNFRLQKVYIANPETTICQRNKDGWQIERVRHKWRSRRERMASRSTARGR